MKKKLLIPILALCAAFTLGGCSLDSLLGGGSSDGSQSSSADAEKSYTVTFKQAGQPDVVETVKEGESLTQLPQVKEKTGYTVAWEEVDLTNISEDIIVEAVETPNVYQITYDVNGGDALESATQSVTYDAAYTLATPTREDWGFIGWQYGTDLYTQFSGEQWKVASDVTFVAQWSDERPSVSVTFEQYGQASVSLSVKKGETLTQSDIPTPQDRVGYQVDKDNWYVDADCKTVADLSTAVTASYSVYAKETPNAYTLSYDLNYENAPTIQSVSVNYDAAYTLMNNPERTGYNFLGWKAYDEDNKEITLSSPWKVVGNVLLKAQWEEIIPETYTIKFVYNSSLHSSVTILEGETIAAADIPAVPTAEAGYNVVGWCVDEACTQAADFSSITAETTVYAKKFANKYQITYEVPNGTLTDGAYTQEVVFDEAYSLKTPVHNVAGFDFAGWLNGETVMPAQGDWSITSDVTLTAQWTDNRATYTVTFMRGNAKVGELSVKSGEVLPQAEIPAIADKVGYDVDTQNWYTDAACTTVADLSVAVTGSYVVYVKEVVQTYTITYYVGENGKLPSGIESSFTITYGEAVTLAKPTRTGYIFSGWSFTGEDGKQVKVKSGDEWKYVGDKTLIANWMKDEDGEWTGNY